MAKEEKNIGIKIQEIKELSFSNKLPEDLIQNYNEENIDLQLGFAVKGDSKKQTVTISIIINYRYHTGNNKKSKEFLKLETETTFKVLNYDEDDIKFNDKKNEVFINDELMSLFLNTSIGATRGMFAYKTASLPIKLVLPCFDLKSLIGSKEDLTLD